MDLHGKFGDLEFPFCIFKVCYQSFRTQDKKEQRYRVALSNSYGRFNGASR